MADQRRVKTLFKHVFSLTFFQVLQEASFNIAANESRTPSGSVQSADSHQAMVNQLPQPNDSSQV